MKTIITTIFCMVACINVYTQNLTVNVETPGTLRSLLEGVELDASSLLSISGSLNGTDIKYLRDLYGYNSLEEDMPENAVFLTRLSLEEAEIVEGGEAYFYIPTSSMPEEESLLYTENNTVGPFMFSYCPSMLFVVLPKSTEYIGSFAFDNTENPRIVESPLEAPPACDETAFYKAEEMTLIVPDGSKEAYAEKEVWERFGTILEKHEYELGIDGMFTESSGRVKDNIYDLQGRRLLSAPAKGLYIRNGRKYLLR